MPGTEVNSLPMSVAVRFEGISKSYPGVRALHDVTLDIREGSVHALMGENGAGKSTLGKILAGLIQKNEGSISLFGKKTEIRNPGDAVSAGIGMVHQELLFCDNMTVAENLCLSDLPRKAGFLIDRQAMVSEAKSALDKIKTVVDPTARLGSLPVAQQQMVQIAGALHQGAKILVFDEPTSSLSYSESERLFELIDDLKARGVTCIYVSHRMSEIFRLCDTITVLRDGEHIVTKPASEFTPDTLATAMIGREMVVKPSQAAEPGETLLKVSGLSSPGRFSEVSFEVRAGEVLGIAGLVGAGRTETVEAIFGLDKNSTGVVSVRGDTSKIRNPREAIKKKIGLVPEDRKRHGLVLGMKIRENITLPILSKVSSAGVMSPVKEKQISQSFFDRLRIKAPNAEYSVLGLSGGNQQKVVIAKWAASNCDVLIVDEPTRGVDVGAKSEIYDILREIVQDNKAVIMVSSELAELIEVATRILVFRNGKVVAELQKEEANEERIIRLMTGVDA